jgi:hypothetical protein
VRNSQASPPSSSIKRRTENGFWRGSGSGRYAQARIFVLTVARTPMAIFSAAGSIAGVLA